MHSSPIPHSTSGVGVAPVNDATQGVATVGMFPREHRTETFAMTTAPNDGLLGHCQLLDQRWW